MSELPAGNRGAVARYIPPIVALLFALILGAVILNVYSGKASDAAVALVRALVWPSFAVVAILFFREQAEHLLRILLSKVEAAQKMTVGSVIIESGTRQIPVPRSGEPVTLENVALLHTSFSRPDKTVQFSDGLEYFQIEVVVVAPSPTLDRITKVTYRLDPNYGKRSVNQVSDRQSRFKLKELANGSSIIRAEIDFEGQDEPLYLNRFIDLRPTGPRI